MRYIFHSFIIALSFCFFIACNNTADSNNTTSTASKANNSTQTETNTIQNGERIEESITVKAIGNTMSEMAFDQKEIAVQANSKVKLTLINESKEETMFHNILIVKKGSANKIGMQAISLKSKNYIPDNKDIIAASDLAKPGETVLLEFDAPAKGEYEFLCTFPGHHTTMRGVFRVM